MSVTEAEVRHVAALARLGLDPEHIPTIAAELNGILAHMESLSKVNTATLSAVTGVGTAGTPLRVGGGNQISPAPPRGALGPAMRGGFLFVSRPAADEDQKAPW